MIINDLQAFVYIYQLESFTKAAHKVHRSQPELSKRLHAMEDELNVQLVDTSNRRRVQITANGRIFYRYALHILQEYQQMMQELAQSRHHLKRVLKVGTIPVAGQYGIASCVAEFNRHYPQLQVTLLENEGDVVMDQLQQGRLDAAILRDTQASMLTHTDYRRATLTSDDLVVVMSRNHPLAQRQSVTIADLRDVPIASLPEGSGVFEPIVKLFGDVDLHPNIEFQSTHIETLTGLLTNQGFVTILFHQSVQPFMNDRLVMRPLSPGFRSNLQLIYQSSQGSYQLKQLLSYLRANLQAD